MAKPRYDYYLVENTYVARYDPQSMHAEQLLPDGTWVPSMRTAEIFNGRPLKNEREARKTAAFLIARNRDREAARRAGK